jgi:hypothetical protein
MSFRKYEIVRHVAVLVKGSEIVAQDAAHVEDPVHLRSDL